MVDFKRIISEINDMNKNENKIYSLDIDYELFLLDKNNSKLSTAIFNKESSYIIKGIIIEMLLSLLTVFDLVGGEEDLEVELYKRIDSIRRRYSSENDSYTL